MFYRTQIKSVTGSVVVDKDGKNLQFMGYLPVKAGDWVFTDGKFIFGNVPPRGSPAVFAEVQSGIPVLADDLRGYFAKNGSFRNYAVAQDDWIVNSEKNFNHGSNETDNGKIIDAEVFANNIYTAEKKLTLLKKEYNDFHFGFYSHNQPVVISINDDGITDSYPADELSNASSPSLKGGYYVSSSYYSGMTLAKKKFWLTGDNLDYRMSDDNITKKCELIIRKDNNATESIDLATLLKDYEDSAKDDVNIDIPNHEYFDHIESRAIVQNFKILPDGNWEALIKAEIWAARTFKVISREKVFQHREQTTTWFRPDYREMTGGIVMLGYEETYTYRVIDSSYDTELVPPEYSSTVSHNLLLLKIDSYGHSEEVFEVKHPYPLIMYDYCEDYIEYFNVNTSTTNPHTAADDFSAENKYPILYSSGRNEFSLSRDTISVKLSELTKKTFDTTFVSGAHSGNALIGVAFHPVLQGETTSGGTSPGEHYVPYTYYHIRITTVYDSRNLRDVPNYYSVAPQTVTDFSFYIQDEYYAKLSNVNEDIEKWLLFGVLDGGNNMVCKEIREPYEYHKSCLSFAPLRSGYLLGVREDEDRDIGGVLYKIDRDGNVEQVGTGLKNFRLRELKNISKARR